MMKFIPFAISLIVISCCNNTDVKIKNNNLNSSMSILAKDTILIDTNSFSYFEKLVQNNELIPSYLILKYFEKADEFFNIDSSIIFGIDLLSQDENKLIYLKQNDDKKFRTILLSYNVKNDLIDFKVFETRCRNCETPLLVKDLIYSHLKKPIIIEIWQFKLKTLAKPNLNTDEVINKDKYIYQSNGVLKRWYGNR